MKGRDRGRRKHTKSVILAGMLLVLVVIYLVADQRYRMQKRAFYEEKIAGMEQVIDREKSWIRQNVGQNGVIYMNTSNGAKDVNPYFACQAALGLLAGEPKEKDLRIVASYLNWHSRQVIEYEGIVSNYTTKDEELVPTGQYDSVDSYLALYLTALHTYHRKGGSLTLLTDWQEAVKVCAEQLAELTENGLSCVSKKNEVSYLMDNVEVWEACKGMEELLDAEAVKLEDWDAAEQLYVFFKEQTQQIEAAVTEQLWSQEQQRYEIGLDGKGRKLEFTGWEDLYPSAVAQIYPAAVGMDLKKTPALYQNLCEVFSWEYLKTDTTFEWPVIAYVGAVCGDESRPEIYMKEFEKKYQTNRNYPLHTATSGWVARACEQMILLYEKRADSGLLADIFR